MIEIIYNNNLLYLGLFLITLYVLLRYKLIFNKDNLLDYFIYLTNKLFLFLIMLNSLILFLVTLILEIDITNFINIIFPNLLYYITINYLVFYMIKFIYYLIKMVKENELFGINDFSKIKLQNVEEKER